MCIDDTKWKNDVPCPKFGEVVTVSGESVQINGPAYEFAEYGKRNWYSKRYFAPLSGLDETELVTEEFEEKYCVPANK
jgi:hypothetical protein